MDVKALLAAVKVFEFTALAVAATPFTVEVIVFVDELKVFVLEGMEPLTKLPLASNPK